MRHRTAGFAGVLAVATGVAMGELVATLGRPQAGPVVAVGSAMIDSAPTPVKEFAVSTFGTYDKPFLLGGIGVALAAIAFAMGVLTIRNRWYTVAGAAVFGLAGTLAAVTRPSSRWFDAVPSLLAAATAVGVLQLLLAAEKRQARFTAVDHPAPRMLDRRAFMGTAALVAVGAAGAGTGAAALRRVQGGAAARSRVALKLPTPADPAPPLPAGVDSGFITANADFYRVDTGLILPQVDLDAWRLRIHGMVGHPIELTLDELLGRPLIERVITLNCVSNDVGGPYIGTARWLGVPLAPLLREADVQTGADQVVARSVEGMTIGTPVATLLDGRDAMLAVGMNGEPLPIANGFPVRMLTPGLYGYVGSCKWLAELELSTFADFDAYWVKRGWAAQGPVKTASRIDKPQQFAEVPAGTVTVAGVAWAQHRGIRAVEVQVDKGVWRPATLLPVPSTDTWVQWRYAWAGAVKGEHTLRVRATDSRAQVQTEERTDVFPSGATGWHAVSVTVR